MRIKMKHQEINATVKKKKVTPEKKERKETLGKKMVFEK